MSRNLAISQGASAVFRFVQRLGVNNGVFLMYFILYKDAQGQWRWTFRAANHEPICVSSEAYTTKQNAQHSINLVKAGAPTASTYDETTKTWQ